MSVVLIEDTFNAHCVRASLAKVLSNFVWMSGALHKLPYVHIVEIQSRCSECSGHEFSLLDELKHMH